VKPTCERATGWERKEVKDTLVRRVLWEALRREGIWYSQIKRE
jgi:hypothetical protein